MGLATDKVYEYDLTGVYTGFNFSVTNQDTNPTGVTRRGNKFLVTGDSTNRVYEYDISGIYTGLLNSGISVEDAVEIVIGKLNIEHSLEVAKINANASIESSKNATLVKEKEML